MLFFLHRSNETGAHKIKLSEGIMPSLVLHPGPFFLTKVKKLKYKNINIKE